MKPCNGFSFLLLFKVYLIFPAYSGWCLFIVVCKIQRHSHDRAMTLY